MKKSQPSCERTWAVALIGLCTLVMSTAPAAAAPNGGNEIASKGDNQAANHPGSPPVANAAETGKAESAADAIGPWEPGPKKIALGQELTVELPSGYAYLPPVPAKKLLEMNGSFHNDGVLGLFSSVDPAEEWFVVARFDDEGFVKDDEELDAEEILSALRDGLDEAIEERQERGFKPLALDGWAEAPRYDQAQHHVVWALIVSDADGKSVNLNTRILGRRGYVSLNLVTDPAMLPTYRHHAPALLAATRFDAGARYEDFQEGTDKVAEYGLAGLVMAGAGVGAAKLVKLGLLAKFSKVLFGAVLAGKKFLILGAVAAFALIKKFMGRKEPATPAPPGE